MKLSSFLILLAHLATVAAAALTDNDAQANRGSRPLHRALPGNRGGAPIRPKMIAEEVSPDRPNLFEEDDVEDGETITSNNAIYMGDCSPSTPFVFDLGSRSGRGAVGALCDVASDIDIISTTHGVTIEEGEPQPNFWALEGQLPEEDFCGVAVSFEVDEPASAGSASVTCTKDTPVVVIVRDDDVVDGAAYVAEATVSCEGRGNSQRLELKGETSSKSKSNLKGQTRAAAKSGGNQGNVSKGLPVNFENTSNKAITIKKNNDMDSDAGLSLIQVTLDDGEGREVYRTFVTEAKRCKNGAASSSRRLMPIAVQSSGINEDGDVELEFDLSNLPGETSENERFKVQARIGISSAKGDEEGSVAEIIHRTVDMTAFLSRKDSSMVVHGGWIRRALASIGSPPSGWDVIVEEAIVSDPEASYRVLARMEDAHMTGVGADQTHRRTRITKSPTKEEHDITDDMRQGRKPLASVPEDQGSRGLRSLQTVHKKILVHGYCANTPPFPQTQFSNDVAFSDPDARRRLGGNDGGNNWTNNQFAVKIAVFAAEQGITGCGIIAHSQGGLAALHLYTYYWSCLDYANQGGSRLIQSVGSPYQGTPLAGNLAGLGSVFGVGCGTQNDLSTSGAQTWLSFIPSWTREQVNYYTTSFATAWWRWDYCSSATDLLLGDPEDGTVEKGRGQLPNGVNRGHKYGYCHTSGMRDPHQAEDSGRNSIMNTNAKF